MPHPEKVVKTPEEKAAIHAELKKRRQALHATPEHQAARKAAIEARIRDRK